MINKSTLSKNTNAWLSMDKCSLKVVAFPDKRVGKFQVLTGKLVKIMNWQSIFNSLFSVSFSHDWNADYLGTTPPIMVLWRNFLKKISLWPIVFIKFFAFLKTKTPKPKKESKRFKESCFFVFSRKTYRFQGMIDFTI